MKKRILSFHVPTTTKIRTAIYSSAQRSESSLFVQASFKMSDELQSQASQFELFNNALDGVAQLYHDTKTADVQFTFGSHASDGTVTRIPAHKNLLAAGSKVFRTMFYGDLKETGDVRVVDTSDAAFKEFLQVQKQFLVKMSSAD